MPIEKKDLLDFLGLKEEPETIDAFKEAFQKDFIARSAAASDPVIRDAAASKLGNVMGKAESIFKQELKYFGIEKVDGEKLEEIIPSGLGALKTQFETLKAGDKKTKDQKFLEVESDRDKYKTQFESEKERADKANELFEKEKQERAQFEKSWIIKQKFEEDVVKKAPWTDDYRNDEVRQKGFSAILNEKVIWDLDENKSLIGLRREDGKPFTNLAGNKIMTPLEIVVEIGNPAKVIANNSLNNPKPKQPINPQGNGQPESGNVHNYKRKS